MGLLEDLLVGGSVVGGVNDFGEVGGFDVEDFADAFCVEAVEFVVEKCGEGG